MASISTRTVDGKPRYDVNYREPDGRRRRKTFTRKKAAEDFAVTVETDKLRGTYIDRNAGTVTFKAYADDWLAAQTFDPASRAAIERRLRRHAYPVLGGRTLASIKPGTIQSWLATLGALSGSYRRDVLSTVSAVLSAAVDDERIMKNPCRAGSVRPPRPERRRVVPWTPEQLAAVLEALPARHRVAGILGAGLGLRQGEVFGLAVDDVDFLRGVVHVRRQVKLLDDASLVFGPTKSRREREVPLPGSVRDTLAAHLAAHPARAVTLDGVTHNLIVTTRQGTPLSRNYFNARVWRPALVAAGVERGRENGMHALRHFYASSLLHGGESIRAVSEYLGHTDPGFTLRTYTHLMPSSAERTRSAVDAAFACYMGATSAPRTGAR